MGSIFRKELNLFFSSLVGYIAIIIFLLITGLFMWVLPETNMLDYGYASMEKFFTFSPWVFIFLIPAITMKTFSEEYKSGTIEILNTLPISEFQIVWGKYLASFVLLIFALLPTLLYVFSIYKLSLNNIIDTGGIAGSYVGLLFLASAFTSVGLFCSSLTSNQIVAFLVAVVINFFLYSGFESISKIPLFRYNGIDNMLSQIGMQFHFQSISRGVIDTRDLIYFLSVTILFILATVLSLQKRKW